MHSDAYKEALKMGQKAYRQAVTKGNYPYLSALEDITSFSNIEREQNLGLVEIPMHLIVGTKTAGRTNSFANNFMPLLEEESEFASKWVHLYKMLQDEGLRDPIKAYEYLNHFYVMEGNKRVSVMKYMGAVSIPGQVIRIVPRKTETKENKLYYEFMDFYEVTGINYVIFNELGEYHQLLKEVGKKDDEVWDEEERKFFHSFFTRFEKAYKAKAGNNPIMSTSEALLVYLNIYPYYKSRDNMPAVFKENITKSWEEFVVRTEDQAVELSMQPTENGKQNIIQKFFSDTKNHYHIAFIYDKSPEMSSWTYGHELGRLYLEQKFSDKITTSVYSHVNPENLDASVAIIEEAIQDGNDIIFTTTPKLLTASMKAAIDHPNVKIMNCSVNTMHPNIRVYYGRMYEAKFLIGAIAGILSKSDVIGYIADYPIYGMIANINAFALGVKMVNPKARVRLEWSTLEDNDCYRHLHECGAEFISDKDFIIPDKASRLYGLYRNVDDKVENYAAPVWHWGKFYELIMQSIFSGTWKAYKASDGVKALNFWWGMASEVIDIVYSQNMPEGVKRLTELLKKNITSLEFYPFSGLLYDQDGNVRHEDETPMLPEDVVTMDWLVDNIDGEIPKREMFNDEARQIISVLGVGQSEVKKD